MAVSASESPAGRQPGPLFSWLLAWGMVLDALEQLARRHAEAVGDLGGDFDAGVASPRLDTRDVAQGEAGFVGQHFLGQVALVPQTLDVRGECLQRLHTAELSR